MNAPPVADPFPWKTVVLLVGVAVVVAWLSGFAAGLLVRILL